MHLDSWCVSHIDSEFWDREGVSIKNKLKLKNDWRRYGVSVIKAKKKKVKEDILPILCCFNQTKKQRYQLLLFRRCHMCNIKIPAGTDMTSLGFFL